MQKFDKYEEYSRYVKENPCNLPLQEYNKLQLEVQQIQQTIRNIKMNPYRTLYENDSKSRIYFRLAVDKKMLKDNHEVFSEEAISFLEKLITVYKKEQIKIFGFLIVDDLDPTAQKM